MSLASQTKLWDDANHNYSLTELDEMMPWERKYNRVVTKPYQKKMKD